LLGNSTATELLARVSPQGVVCAAACGISIVSAGGDVTWASVAFDAKPYAKSVEQGQPNQQFAPSRDRVDSSRVCGGVPRLYRPVALY